VFPLAGKNLPVAGRSESRTGSALSYRRLRCASQPIIVRQ